MNLTQFILHFKEEFLDASDVLMTPHTDFRSFDSWDSLTGMALIIMIKDKYEVDISEDEFKSCKVVEDVFNIIVSKKS